MISERPLLTSHPPVVTEKTWASKILPRSLNPWPNKASFRVKIPQEDGYQADQITPRDEKKSRVTSIAENVLSKHQKRLDSHGYGYDAKGIHFEATGPGSKQAAEDFRHSIFRAYHNGKSWSSGY